MKRVALAVNYDYHDYGGMLQAFATQRALSKMGIESETINFEALKGSIRKRKWKYFLRNLTDLSIVTEKSRIVGKQIRRRVCRDFGQNLSLRDKAFEDFCKSHFIVSPPFDSWETLRNACHDYDAVIVGSDQLWLPSNVEADYYTLTFVPDGVKKVAYATSFGIGAIPRGMQERYARFLKRIDCLSARETSGKEIIMKCTGRDVPLVCDPTLLLTVQEWDKYVVDEKPIQEDYIFCYFMGDNPEQREFAKRLAKKEGCKIVALLHLDQYIPADETYVDIAPYEVSPADFVRLVKHAKYVCTDSFHGTVFSVIYSKDFFTFKRFNKKASLSTNTRIESILGKLKLENRLYDGREAITEDIHIRNYPQVQACIDEFRQESIKYITNSLA